MRKRNYLVTLLLTAALILSMSAMGWAMSKNFAGRVTYKGGNTISSSYDGNDLAAQAADLEPGDDITITIEYKNEHKKTTDWFLRNDVLQTLEESGTPAENGGYTYILTDSNVGEIYNNSDVGGENPDSIPEGLKQATEGSDGEYFAINTLEPGQSGTTTLKILFDGETEVNDYQTTVAKLDLQYAVEEHGEDITEENIIEKRIVKTGDSTNILATVGMFAAALLFLILAVISRRKDRKEGGEDA